MTLRCFHRELFYNRTRYVVFALNMLHTQGLYSYLLVKSKLYSQFYLCCNYSKMIAVL
jgi:hypothetical protein